MTSAGIEFELTRKRVKNINLRIHPPDGRVTVSAPLRTSEARIAAFVAARAGDTNTTPKDHAGSGAIRASACHSTSGRPVAS